MNICTYCEDYYSRCQVTLERSHFNQDARFVKGRNRNDEAGLGTNGNRQKQMQYHSSFNSAPPPKGSAANGMFSNKSSRGYNKQYVPRQGL